LLLMLRSSDIVRMLEVGWVKRERENSLRERLAWNLIPIRSKGRSDPPTKAQSHDTVAHTQQIIEKSILHTKLIYIQGHLTDPLKRRT
jgi:hypothetical protein